MTQAPHIPVMLNEVLAALAPKAGEIYVDGTFGAGGYTKAFLDKADCRVIAIDRDKTALENGKKLKEKYGDRLTLLYGQFGDAATLVRGKNIESVDGFILDVGVSSMQIDRAARGFSFRFDGPLDMRMDPDGGGQTAADIVNEYDEKELADIIYKYGEERHSRRIARAIVMARAEEPITTTARLADIIRGAVPKSKKDLIDPATRTFQALRIYVNDELGELQRALDAAEELLAEGGRLVVVSFHSLEDAIVKKFLRERAGQEGRGSRYLPEAHAVGESTFTLPSRKAVQPSDEEANANPRARSAKMRVAVRTNAPSWQGRRAA